MEKTPAATDRVIQTGIREDQLILVKISVVPCRLPLSVEKRMYDMFEVVYQNTPFIHLKLTVHHYKQSNVLQETLTNFFNKLSPKQNNQN